MLKLRKNKKGFTLVELIVVIAIMAVLAGTIAGVTVSQLNKQTDKTMASEAKGIADFISTWIIENNIDLTATDVTSLDTIKTAGTNGQKLMDALKAQYGTEKVVAKPANNNVEKGTIAVSFVEGKNGNTADKTKNCIMVEYKGKQRSGGDVSYTVNVEGVVAKGTTPAANEGDGN